MHEYISREAARPDAFCEGMSCQECPFCKDPVQGGCRIDDFVKSIPAADVVEVVRCYECKYWEHRPDRQYDLCAYLFGAKRSCNPEDFCSRGERKGGQDDV